MITKTNYNLI